MKISILVLFTLCMTQVFAQHDTLLLSPGTRQLTTKHFKNYTAEYDFFIIKNGVEQKVGGLKESFSISNAVALRVANITFGSNKILDSGLLVLKTLAPIYHRSLQTNKRMSFDFNGTVINGTIAKGDSVLPVHFENPTLLFDSYFEDVLVTAIPLKKDLHFKFPEFIYERGGLVWSTGQVLGPCGNKCWSVAFFEKDNAGNTVRTTTYRIDPKTRQIISREYKMANSTMIMRRAVTSP